MKKKLFDPEKSLISLGIFKAVILTHTIAALCLSIAIIYNSNLSPNFSYEGVNFFVEVFRVPLAILALIIPMVALLASNHRSEQTIAQIKSSTSQNTFSNHYKHLEEFEKYCDTLFGESNKVTRPRHLHRLIYSDSQQGNYLISKSFVESTERHISICLELMKEMESSEYKIWAPATIKLTDAIKSFSSDHHMYIKSPPSGSVLAFEGRKAMIPDNDIRNVLVSFFMQIRTLKKAVDFAPSVYFDSITHRIVSTDLSLIPKYDISRASNFAGIELDIFLAKQTL